MAQSPSEIFKVVTLSLVPSEIKSEDTPTPILNPFPFAISGPDLLFDFRWRLGFDHCCHEGFPFGKDKIGGYRSYPQSFELGRARRYDRQSVENATDGRRAGERHFQSTSDEREAIAGN
jgi:hypothetical protein